MTVHKNNSYLLKVLRKCLDYWANNTLYLKFEQT